MYVVAVVAILSGIPYYTKLRYHRIKVTVFLRSGRNTLSRNYDITELRLQFFYVVAVTHCHETTVSQN